MKKNHHHTSRKLAILAASLAFSGAALAATPGDAPRHAERGGHHACHHHGMHKGYAHSFHKGHHGKANHHAMQERRAGLIIPGYGVVSRDFVEGMGLDEAQHKLIQEARDAARDLRKQQRESMRNARKTGGGQGVEHFASIDPEQAIKQADERRRKAMDDRRQVDEKWLAVWKSLNADQQTRVSGHLKQRAEKAAKRAEKFEERRKQREDARAERGRGGEAAQTDART